MTTPTQFILEREQTPLAPKIRHVYHSPYDRTLCGLPRDRPIEELVTFPTPHKEYCVVCMSMAGLA